MLVLAAFIAAPLPNTAVGHGTAVAQTALPDATPANQLYINQTELSHSLGQLSPYIALYATFNNTTIHKLPYANTAEPAGFNAWITFNATIVLNKNARDVLTFANVTSANGTGFLAGNGIKVTSAHAYWADYIEYLYTDYQWTISAPQFSLTSTGPTATLVNQTRPGHAEQWLNTTETFVDASLTLVIASNYTIGIVLPSTFNGPSNNPQFGETVTPVYTFSSQVEQTPAVQSFKTTGLVIHGAGTAGWENITASYTESNTTSQTTGGVFYSDTVSFFGFFVTFWWVTIILILLVAFVAVVIGRSSRRR